MFGGSNGQPGGNRTMNATDFTMADVDLDHFLDNYLVQLGGGTNHTAPQQTGLQGIQQLGGMNNLMGGLGQILPGSANQQQPAMTQLQQQQLLQQLASGLGGGFGAPAQALSEGGSGKGGAPKSARSKGGRGKLKSEDQSSEDDGGSDDDDDDEDDDDGGEPRSRKKLAIGGDDAERKHIALQEKNRRAQRRFRERQKTKLHDLHKQIDDLTSKVGTLQSENAALHSRTNILEKVLDMRNEQIQVMQETKEATGYLGGAGEEDNTSLAGLGGSLVQLTPETIKDLGSEQIYKMYQMYVKELSVLLSEGATGPEPGTESALQLEVLVKDLSMMIMRLGVVKPLETRKFIVVSRQYLGSTESEVIELWKSVMRSINLTEQQQREVVELKRMFLQKIEPIMEERKQLNVQIQSNLPHDTFATKNALTYIKAHEAVLKLRDNLRAEQHVVLEFAIAVFRGVFKPWQMATLLVKCYPAVPDALGIASALAVELGEPDMPMTRQLTLQLGGYLEGQGVSSGAREGAVVPSSLSSLAGLNFAARSGAECSTDNVEMQPVLNLSVAGGDQEQAAGSMSTCSGSGIDS